MHNPYNAPTADLSRAGESTATYVPTMFELKGRVGRVRFLAYSFGLTMLAGLAMAVVMGLLAAISRDLIMIGLVMYIPIIAASLVVATRRLNDMGHTGWLSVLTLVPLVNIFIGLWLIFGAGNADANQYGPPPAANTRVLVWLACGLPLVAIIGVLAAVAIPAYQGYVMKAKAAQAISAP